MAKGGLTAGEPNGPVYEAELLKIGAPWPLATATEEVTSAANARWGNGYMLDNMIWGTGGLLIVWRKRQP
jgi:hypothetical protein